MRSAPDAEDRTRVLGARARSAASPPPHTVESPGSCHLHDVVPHLHGVGGAVTGQRRAAGQPGESWLEVSAVRDGVSA